MARILLRDLTAGTDYTLQIRSNANGAVSEWSRVFSLTTDTGSTPPSIPTNVALTMSGTSFTATWDAVTTNQDGLPASNLDHYEIEISSSGAGEVAVYKTQALRFDIPIEVNTAIFASPQANIRVRVAAISNTGLSSGYSAQVQATNPPPAQPANFSAKAGIDVINMSWDSVSDSDLLEYRVYYGTTAGFTPSNSNLVFKGKVTSFTHSNVLYGSDSFYKLAAIDVFNTPSTYAASGAIRPNSSTGVDSTPPDAPTGVTVTANPFDIATQRASLTVSWTASVATDVRSYVVRYSTTGTSDWSYVTVPGDQTSVSIDNVIPGKTYYVSVKAVDYAANSSAFVNASTYPITSSADTTAPSTPNAPTATTASQKIQVVHNQKQADGTTNMESDVSYYEVYADTSSGFTPGNSTMLGTMRAGVVAIETFQIPAQASSGTTQNWYVKVIAVDRSGNRSPASASSAAAAVGLVGDLQITGLDAAKINANSVFTQNLGVQSIFTLGDATHDGAIQSYGYAAGVSGFNLAKSGLEINEGSVAAAALRIQNSPNIVPIQFAGFEFAPAYYTSAMYGSDSVSILSSGAKYGSQYASFRAAGAATSYAVLAPSSTSYNINIEASKTYIISAWVKTGTVASTVALQLRYSDGTYSPNVGATLLPASGTWQRIYGMVTAPAGVAGALLIVNCTTATVGAGADVDGVQVEEKLTGLSTPSTWKPSGATYVDGGYIRTGEIRSNTTTTVNGVTQPNWSINMAGNAQFGDALIRGKMLVGTTGDPDSGQSFIQSGNFVTGSTGWKVDSSGNAEFNAGKFRGRITADSALFGDLNNYIPDNTLQSTTYRNFLALDPQNSGAGFTANGWGWGTSAGYFLFGSSTLYGQGAAIPSTTRDLYITEWMPARRGMKFYGSAQCRVTSGATGTASMYMRVKRADGSTYGMGNIFAVTNANNANTMKLYEGTTTVPTDADQVIFVLRLANDVTVGNFWFNDLNVRPALFSSAEIQGATIRTATSGARVEMDNAGGIRSYRADGSPNITIGVDNSLADTGIYNGMILNQGSGIAFDTTSATEKNPVIYYSGSLGGLQLRGAASTAYGAGIGLFSNTSTAGGIIRFYTNNAVGVWIGTDGTIHVSGQGQFSGQLQSDGTMNTTAAGSANLVISTTSGYIYRSTSSERYKIAINRSWAPEVEAIMGLKPATYYDKANAERYNSLVENPESDVVCDYPVEQVGLIAEDVHALGLRHLVAYNEKGQPDAVNYDRIAVTLIPIIQQHEREIAELKRQLAEMSMSHGILETKRKGR